MKSEYSQGRDMCNQVGGVQFLKTSSERII